MIERMNFWNKKKKRIFLDYASITPVDPLVLEKLNESVNSGNPSAIYDEGIKAKDAVTSAKVEIAKILNCRKEEIFFTSGGTESNNIALLGVFETYKKDLIPHVITTSIEHPAILEVCKEIEKRGGEVTYVSPNEEGIVNQKDIVKAIKSNTVLVSVMQSNNEIGTIQPIKEIGRGIKEWRQINNTEYPFFHSDACQSALYLNLDMQKLGLDLLTLDGIKLYGPRGLGILAVRGNVSISPVQFGGGQQNGLRSGTENVSGIIGFATALKIAEEKKESESLRLSELRDYAIKKILEAFPNSTLNGSKENRLPNNISICFPSLDAEFAVVSLDVAGISASYSSSCRTLAENSSSYVVEAIGKKDCSLSSLRFTLGRESTKNEIDILILALCKIIKQN